MSVRNRGRSTNYARPSSGGGFLRQALMFLSLGALSFLLGFFVLAGLMPGHGPETPAAPISSPSAPSAPTQRRPAPIHLQPAAPPESTPPQSTASAVPTPTQPNAAAGRDVPATGPSVSPLAAGVPAAKGPTLDPLDSDPNGGATQPAAGLDTARPDTTSAGAPAPASDTSTLIVKHRTHRRRTRKKHPIAVPTDPATAGEQAPAALDGANPPLTQPPADPGDTPKTEGSGTSGGVPDKGGSGQGNGGNP